MKCQSIGGIGRNQEIVYITHPLLQRKIEDNVGFNRLWASGVTALIIVIVIATVIVMITVRDVCLESELWIGRWRWGGQEWVCTRRSHRFEFSFCLEVDPEFS